MFGQHNLFHKHYNFYSNFKKKNMCKLCDLIVNCMKYKKVTQMLIEILFKYIAII